MRKDLPIYEISIDLNNEETTLEKNSLVFDPAHEKAFQTFSKVQRWQFNDEERIVIGVAISADTPIYRKLKGEECYVVFTKQAIKAMVYDYARRGNFNKVNIEHKTDIEGLSMVYSYQIDKDKGLTAPERFKDENDGSWIVGYKVANDEIWAKVKDGEFRGFSVEGVFEIGDSEFSQLNEILEQLKQIQ
jgi:hypothetical protein